MPGAPDEKLGADLPAPRPLPGRMALGILLASVVLTTAGVVLYLKLTSPATREAASAPRPAPVSQALVEPLAALPLAGAPAEPVATIEGETLSGEHVAAPGSEPKRRRDTDLAAERALVEHARSALTRGAPEKALLDLTQHARAFPRGRLAEERDGLRVVALAKAGRHAEAAERAAEFRQRYPGSVFLPTVDAAMNQVR